MIYKYAYKTQEDKMKILSENKHLFLREDNSLFTGNTLVFSDEKNAEEEITDIKQTNEDLATYVLDVDMRLVLIEMGF